MPATDTLRAHLCYSPRTQWVESAAPFSPSFTSDVRDEKPFGENFTLENFIINKKNFFPLAIAREITKPQKEPSYNPIVYYGKSGSGKTHLLRAVANALSKIYGYRAVFYCNMAEFIQRGEHGGIDEYQAYLVDDIHSFASDPSLQKKMLVFLDACLYAKKQFVCACSDIFYRGLSGSLRSRFRLGLKVELKEPDIDVRMRFAQAQCVLHSLDLSQEHMLLLAQRCAHLHYLANILQKIAAHKKLAQRKIDKQDIENIFQHSSEQSPITPHDIIHQVAAYFSLSPEEITSNKRKSALVFVRQIAMYICREMLGFSYSVIGQFFGGKDHSSVIYNIKKIEKSIVMNKDLHIEITKLKNMFLQKKI